MNSYTLRIILLMSDSFKNLISLNSAAFRVTPLFKTEITVVYISLSCLIYGRECLLTSFSPKIFLGNFQKPFLVP